MQVLLRQRKSGLFYQGPEQWTAQHGHARVFEGPDRALDTVCSENLDGVEVVLHFGDPIYDVPLTIAGLGR